MIFFTAIQSIIETLFFRKTFVANPLIETVHSTKISNINLIEGYHFSSVAISGVDNLTFSKCRFDGATITPMHLEGFTSFRGKSTKDKKKKLSLDKPPVFTGI